MKYPAKPRRNLSCLTWTPILLICVTFLGLIHLADGYRIYGTANATEEFSPYEKGFVGKIGDPSIPQRVTVNPGTESIKEYAEGSRRLLTCQSMVGPIDEKYYCRGKEFGFCDRRSGTCFCNTGYQGLSCQSCKPSHILVGGLCYPRKSCLNDCSISNGGGTCDYVTGKCKCNSFWNGDDCSLQKCEQFDPYCLECDEVGCVKCREGYSVDTRPYNASSLVKREGMHRVCKPCSRFDPRCYVCSESECLGCIDLLLLSIRRAGRRPQDTKILPLDERERELSITVPFGSLQTNAFDEAEHYFLVDQNIPLNHFAVSCHQGTSLDESFYCNKTNISHLICGHYGVISFSSPTYAVEESEGSIRVTVRRSGGGVGQVYVSYIIEHVTTDDSDVSPTASYTSKQQIFFNPGEIEISFLVTIHDDRILEGDEMFKIILTEPSENVTLGPQKRALITIIDDDADRTCSSHSSLSSSTFPLNETMSSIAGKVFHTNIQAISCLGHERVSGGDRFVFHLESIISLNSFGESSFIAVVPFHGLCEDNEDGSHGCDINVTRAGSYAFNMYHLIPGGLEGTYFTDSVLSMEHLSKRRIDALLNFTSFRGRNADFRTAQWVGYLKCQFTEFYTISIQFGDKTRIWLNHNLIIDTWDRDDTVKGSFIFLDSELYYPITIDYLKATKDATVQIFWDSKHTPFSVIPSSAFFVKEHILGSPFSFEVFPSKANPFRSQVEGFNVIEGVSGKENRFSIIPRDRFGNILGVPEDRPVPVEDRNWFYAFAKLTKNTRGGEDGIDFPFRIVFNYNTNLYDVFYVPFISGKYTLSIILNGEFLNNDTYISKHIFGSPFNLTILPGTKTAPTESITYDYSRKCSLVNHFNNQLCSKIPTCVAGNEIKLEIESLDLFKNRRDSGGDKWIVSLESNRTYQHFQKGIIQDNENGLYTVSIVPSSSGYNRLSITLGDIHAKGSPFTVHCDHNVAHGPSSFFITDLSKFEIVATESNHIFIQPVDAYSNPIVNNSSPFIYSVQIKIENKSNSSATETGNFLLLKDGRIRVTIVPHLIGENLLYVLINEDHISESPKEVKVIAGKIGLSTSTASGEGLSGATAGTIAEFFVQARDERGNPTSNFQDEFSIILEMNAIPSRPLNMNQTWGRDAIVYGTSKRIGKGKYQMRYNVTVSGTYAMKVMTIGINGSHHIFGSPFIVDAAPSEAFSPNCIITGNGIKLGNAGTQRTVEIYSRDRFGNFLITGGDKYDLKISLISRHQQKWEALSNISNSAASFYQTKPLNDNENGKYTTYYNPHFSGTYNLTVTIDKPGGLFGSYFDVENYDMSHLLFTQTDFSIDKVWSCVYRESVGCTQSEKMLPQDSFSVEWTGKVEPDHSEEYIIRVQCDSGGEVEVIIDNYHVVEWNTCFGKIDGRMVLRTNKRVNIRIRYRHKNGNSFIQVKWSCPSHRDFEIIPGANLYREMLASGKSYTTEIIPNTLSPQLSTGKGIALNQAIAGINQSFIVEVRDGFGNGKYGNLFLHGGVIVSVFARGGQSNVKERIHASIEDNKNGTYSVHYFPKVIGIFSLSVTVGTEKAHQGLGYYMEDLSVAHAHVLGSPFILRVLAGKTDAKKSHLSFLGPIDAVVGSKVLLEICSKDAYGNKQEKGGDRYESFLTKENALNGHRILEVEAIDSKNGTYILNFTAPTLSGRYFVHIFLTSHTDEQSSMISGSPYQLNVFPANANSSMTHIYSGADLLYNEDGLPTWSFKSNARNKKQFEVVTADNFENYLSTGGENFVARIRGKKDVPNGDLMLQPKDNKDGSYSFTYHLSKKGLYSLDLAMAPLQNGLLGTYFRNAFFSGDPDQIQVDRNIDFNWAYGFIQPHARDFVSIRWTGFIKPDFSEPYEFEVPNSNDRTKVWIENDLVIDTTNSTKGSYLCTGNMLHIIKIEFIEMDESASILLLWKSRRTAKYRVPSSKLYPWAEPIKGSPFPIRVTKEQ